MSLHKDNKLKRRGQAAIEVSRQGLSHLSGASAQPIHGFGRREQLLAVGLAIVTIAVYLQVVNHQFISLDDDYYIVNNVMVTDGLTPKGIAWAFTTFHAANWHPLTWLSHMLDSQFFGLNAGGHLFVSMLIHVANTLFVFVLLGRMTRSPWKSAIIAALFALHPLHVESVAWAAERKDTLATFFGLLSLLAYTRYAEATSLKRYVVVTLWLALGLMAKPMLVTWPFLFLLLDYWPLRRVKWAPGEGVGRFIKTWMPLVREKIPFLALVGASMVVTFIAQSQGGAVRGFEEAPVPLRLANALVSCAKYVVMTFWPSGLAIYYPFSPEGIPFWQVAGAFLLITALTIIALFQAKARPYLIIGWFWFLGTLVPVIGLVQVGGQAMADRYHYIPSIGLFIFLVFGLSDFATAWRMERVGIAVASVSVLISGLLSAIEINRWRDSTTLFERTLAVTPDNLVIQYNLGHVLAQQKKYEDAISHFTEALRIEPDFFDALVNMGVALLDQGKPDEAIPYYERALSVQPNSAKAHMQLGIALAGVKKSQEALVELRRASEISPTDGDIRTNVGLILARLGKLDEAALQLNEALRLKPDSAEAHNNLGLLFLANNQPERASECFSKALQLKPDLTMARDNLKRAQAKINGEQK
jgi:tetratricopeptide (TPR) repeat protein